MSTIALTLSPPVWGWRVSTSCLVYSLNRPTNYCCRICAILCMILKKSLLIEQLCRPYSQKMRIVKHYPHFKIQSNLAIADVLYNGRLVIVDTFLRNRSNHGQTLKEKLEKSIPSMVVFRMCTKCIRKKWRRHHWRYWFFWFF